MTSDMASVLLVAALFVTLIGLAVYIVFLRSLQGVLEHCAPQNRTVSPGQVWLSLIPFFNLVWQFILVSRIAESLQLEFAARQAPAPPEEDYGKTLGIAMCALSLSSIIPLVGIFTGLAGTICWIVYWVRISGYSRALESVSLNLYGGGSSGWTPPAAEPPSPAPAAGSGWLVLVVLLLGYGASYLPRVALSLVAPSLQRELALSSVQLGWVFSAFVFGLMAGYVLMTMVTAFAGTRWCVFVALVGASLAASAGGLAHSLTGLIIARALLGFFVAGLLPAAVQAIREWLPSPTRPFAIGLVLASGQLVSVATPPLSVFFLRVAGWHTLLLLSGLPAVLAAALCIFLWPARTPRESSRGVSGAAIASAGMLVLGLLLTAPVIWALNTWLPRLAAQRFHTGAGMGMAGAVFPVAGACGAVVAGAVAWAMMSGGASASRARAVVLTVCGAILPLVALAASVPLWPIVVFVIAMCYMAYLGWCTLLYSAVAETLPAGGVAIGAAIGGLMATLAGWLVPMASGRLLSSGADQAYLLGVAAAAAIALLVVALLAWLVRQETETAG